MQSGTTAAHAAMGKVQRHTVWFKRDYNGLFVWPQTAPMHMHVWQSLSLTWASTCNSTLVSTIAQPIRRTLTMTPS